VLDQAVQEDSLDNQDLKVTLDHLDLLDHEEI